MAEPANVPRIVRFGVFELDLKTGELRKKGVRVRLQEQPFQVLAMLVQRSGDLVTRDELRARLWPDAVFVDFDQGLNRAVTKIRRALGDLAESPRFVETLERRGYRFIAAVEAVDASHAPGSTHSARPVLVQLTWGDRSIPLPEGTHIIGRDPASTVWIDSGVVSRRHASIVVSAASLTIEDHGSKNGTLVNGAPLSGRAALLDGDQIRVGPAILVVHASTSDTGTLTARSRH